MFILRSRKGLGVCTTPSVKIAVGRRKKTVGISNLGGFHITESTDAGPNKSELRMIPTDPLRPNGLRDNRYHWSLGTDRSAAGVKQISSTSSGPGLRADRGDRSKDRGSPRTDPSVTD